MKRHVLKKGLMCSVLAVGIAGCTMSNEPEVVQTEPAFAGEQPMFLTEQYVETHEVVPVVAPAPRKEKVLKPVQGVDLSASKPAAGKGVSVKEKTKKKAAPKPLTTKKNMAVSRPDDSKKSVKEKAAAAPAAVKSEVVDQKTVIVTQPVPAAGAVTTTVAKVPVTITKKTVTKTVEKTKVVEQKKSVKTGLEAKIEYGESVNDWSAPAGETLRSLLTQWGDKAGWTVVWKLDRDYQLEAGVVFRGTFTDAASALVRSFARATPAPIGEFFNGNRALVVRTQEDENAN